MTGPWTIAELVERAAGALAPAQPPGPGSGSGRPNGRVRSIPNERLVRWYVTVGLVDPPLSRRGRVALYGRRHLLQLVAIKRRQAQGRSLAEIQAELVGATDDSLAAVAGVPDTALPPEPMPRPAPGSAAHAPEPAASSPAADGDPPSAAAQVPARFWTRRPLPPPPREPAAAGQPGRPEPAAACDHHADRGAEQPQAGLVHGIRLAPGVTLLLDGTDHEPGPDDVAAIAIAARPLCEELSSRGLCGPPAAAPLIHHPAQGAAWKPPDSGPGTPSSQPPSDASGPAGTSGRPSHPAEGAEHDHSYRATGHRADHGAGSRPGRPRHQQGQSPA